MGGEGEFWRGGPLGGFRGAGGVQRGEGASLEGSRSQWLGKLVPAKGVSLGCCDIRLISLVHGAGLAAYGRLVINWTWTKCGRGSVDFGARCMYVASLASLALSIISLNSITRRFAKATFQHLPSPATTARTVCRPWVSLVQ